METITDYVDDDAAAAAIDRAIASRTGITLASQGLQDDAEWEAAYEWSQRAWERFCDGGVSAEKAVDDTAPDEDEDEDE